MKYTDWHNHTHYSNLIFRDSTNKTTDLIDKAIELGHGGVGITDHGVISSHVEAIQHMKELKQDDPSLDFKLGLGCELYLVHREEVDKARENQLYTRFYHFIVIAKNRRGYEILKELSSRGWSNSFVYKNVMRTPVYYEDLIEILKNNEGDLVASSACLGSELSHLVLDAANELDAGGEESTGFKEAHIKILNHLKLMKNLFGDDYYIELQPSHSTDQVKYNSLVLGYAKLTGIKPIITTDSHYLRPENRLTHTAFLKAQEAERETDSFYATTYLMTVDEIRSYCEYMEEEEFAACINNTEEIRSKIEEFDLYDSTKVPNAKTIKFDKDYISTINLYTTEKYDYIRKFIFSEHEIDKILIQQIDLGMKRKQLDYNEFHMERINKELGSLWEISVKLNQQLSSYYILTKEIVEIIWKVSLVGVSRGSAGAFFICYLLDITQINPLDYNLPDWRHISKERPELPRLYWAG